MAPPAVWTHRTNHPDTINEPGYTILLHCVKISLFSPSPFVPSSFFFSPKCSGVNNVCVERERERSIQTGNREVFVHHVVGEHLP